MNIISFIRREPAVFAFMVNGVVSIVAGWLFHLQPDQMGIITTVSSGLMTAITAFLAVPRNITLAKGGLVTVLAAFTAFKIHIPAQVQTEIITVLSVFLGLNLRANLTPELPAPAPATRVQ
jgi:hypothetical protein